MTLTDQKFEFFFKKIPDKMAANNLKITLNGLKMNNKSSFPHDWLQKLFLDLTGFPAELSLLIYSYETRISTIVEYYCSHFLE